MRDGRGRPQRTRSVTGGNSNSSSLVISLGALLVLLQALYLLHRDDNESEGSASKSDQITFLDPSFLDPSVKKLDHDARRCSSAAKSLADKRIHFLALDFDLTIIDIHTRGHWKGSSDELRGRIRPVFQCLLNAAIDEGIHIGVVTFNEQKELIPNAMKTAFSRSGHIPFEGKCCGKLYGKNRHMDAAIRDMNLHIAMGAHVSKETTLLIDDDGRNIALARKDGYKTLQFYPNDDPWQLIEAMKSFW